MVSTLKFESEIMTGTVRGEKRSFSLHFKALTSSLYVTQYTQREKIQVKETSLTVFLPCPIKQVLWLEVEQLYI